MVENWFWLAFGAGLASALFNFTGRKTLKGGDPAAFSWLFEFIRLLIFTVLAFGDFYFELNIRTILILLLLGVTEFASVYVFTKMHSLAELSITSVLTRLRLVWVPIFAFVLLGEKLVIDQYLGLILIITGAIVTVSIKSFRSDKGIKTALLSSVLIAVLSVEMKMASEVVSTPILMIFVALPTVLFYPLKMRSAKQRLVKVVRDQYKAGLTFSLTNALSMYLLVSALRIGDASRVMGIYQGVSLISMPLGIIILKEKDRIWWKMAGAALAFLGMLMLR